MSDELKWPGRAVEKARAAHEKGWVVVLVTGVFDGGLHEAHRDFLSKAKDCGEWLVVGVESDRRARELKGEDRPTRGERERAREVLREDCVDGVVILPEEFGEKAVRRAVLEELEPDILAVSTGTLHLLEKKKMMEEIDGKLVAVKRTDSSFSTTKKLADARLFGDSHC